MNKFLNSKEYQILEHALIVGIFIGLSAFLEVLLNSDFALLLSHHLPTFLSIALVNMAFAAIKKYVDAKKDEVVKEVPSVKA